MILEDWEGRSRAMTEGVGVTLGVIAEEEAVEELCSVEASTTTTEECIGIEAEDLREGGLEEEWERTEAGTVVEIEVEIVVELEKWIEETTEET